MVVVRGAGLDDEAKDHVQDGGPHALIPLGFPHRRELVVVGWWSWRWGDQGLRQGGGVLMLGHIA